MILIPLFSVYQKEYSMASNQRHTEFPPDPKYRILFLARVYMAAIAFLLTIQQAA